ncbi:unnamed protein product [marine sediment metagenome]|uniref:Uncharacterized protein n=1 Tax=marine sediment metagenome TaxID=412755 RepID=X1LG52_9ZZZZ
MTDDFRDVEVYFLDLSAAHSGLQVTPHWSKIRVVEVLETNGEFRVELMRGPGGEWLALYNDAVVDGEAEVVAKGQKEM